MDNEKKLTGVSIDIQDVFHKKRRTQNKQTAQNFLNMVVFETQGGVVSCQELHRLMEEYFEEGFCGG